MHFFNTGITYIQHAVANGQASLSCCRATREDVCNVYAGVQHEAVVGGAGTVQVGRVEAAATIASPPDCHVDPAAAVDHRRVHTLTVHTLAVHAVQTHYLVMNPEEEEETATVRDGGWLLQGGL